MSRGHRDAVWDDASVPDLNRYRKNAIGILLLDGSILAVGGLGRVFGAEASSEWEDMKCDHTHYRGHHSVAGLLPDGRVFAAGGDDSEDNLGNYSIEIYSPPYLFQGQRPQIVSPANVPELEPGQALDLSVILPGDLRGQFRVALLQPGTMTHANNFNQRYVSLQLDFVNQAPPPSQSLIRAFIPSDAAIVPPGYYMVTVVSSDGVPSAARWLKILPV